MHILNKIFRKNPNNPLQVCIDSAIEIKDSYQEKEDRDKIESVNNFVHKEQDSPKSNDTGFLGLSWFGGSNNNSKNTQNQSNKVSSKKYKHHVYQGQSDTESESGDLDQTVIHSQVFENKKKRYDFVLQEKGIGSAIKHVGLLQSHTDYF